MASRSQYRDYDITPPGRRVGRPLLYPEQLTLPLPAGTIGRLDAVRTNDETRLDLVRTAIERELRRRQTGQS